MDIVTVAELLPSKLEVDSGLGHHASCIDASTVIGAVRKTVLITTKVAEDNIAVTAGGHTTSTRYPTQISSSVYHSATMLAHETN